MKTCQLQLQFFVKCRNKYKQVTEIRKYAVKEYVELGISIIVKIIEYQVEMYKLKLKYNFIKVIGDIFIFFGKYTHIFFTPFDVAYLYG